MGKRLRGPAVRTYLEFEATTFDASDIEDIIDERTLNGDTNAKAEHETNVDWKCVRAT